MVGLGIQSLCMNKTIELKGYWKFPRNSEWKISGILKLESTGITLTTIGLLDDASNPKGRVELIVGHTNQGHVTLIDSFLTLSTTSMSKGTIGFQTFSVNWCVIGKAFESLEKMNFSSVAFRFQHLESWAKVNGFRRESYESKNNKLGKKLSIDYKQPSPIKIVKDENIDLSLYFSVSKKFPGVSNRTGEISEKVYYNLYYKLATNLFDVIEFIYSLKIFQTIAISNPTKITDIELWERKGHEQKIKFYSKEILELENTRNIHHSEMAIPFSSIEGNRAEVFNHWLNKKTDLSAVYELYYNSVYVDRRFGRTEFLNIIFALETMHRKVLKGVLIQPEEYKGILAKIKGALTIEEQKLMIDKMKYSYQYSLRNRLNELTKKFDFVLELFKEKRSLFIDIVVTTRNYYVHFDEGAKEKIVSEKKFPYYNLILKLLLDAFILSELGLPTDQISSFVKKQKGMHNFLP